MDRLTERKAGITGLSACFEKCDHANNGCDCVRIRSALRRLSNCEDTGLTPEEITAAADRRHNCKMECLLDEYNKVVAERDTLKKALELMANKFYEECGCPWICMLSETSTNPFQECEECQKAKSEMPICWVDYFIQQAQEGQK